MKYSIGIAGATSVLLVAVGARFLPGVLDAATPLARVAALLALLAYLYLAAASVVLAARVRGRRPSAVLTATPATSPSRSWVPVALDSRKSATSRSTGPWSDGAPPLTRPPPTGPASCGAPASGTGGPRRSPAP